jgi:hypothetical protein
MGMFNNSQPAAIDFPGWEREGRAIKAGFDAQLQAIVQRDTEYQIQQGGQMLSSLTNPAAAAAAKVQRKQDAALESFGREKLAILKPEHERLRVAALEALIGAGELMGKLAALEHTAAEFCRRVGLQAPPRVADTELPMRARAFDERLARLNAAPVATRLVARPPVAVPDFDALAQ